MIKFILLFLGLLVSIHANTPSKMLQLYQKGEYNLACDFGANNLPLIENNEAHLSLYAFACLKADRIDRLNTPIILLNQTPEARANASYFSMLVMQKKLLLQSLYDNTSLKSLNFPISSHTLSRVFGFYVKSPQIGKNIKEYIDPSNHRTSYKLYATEFNGKKTIAIDEYYDKILTIHHIY
jgi:hypothetical protein